MATSSLVVAVVALLAVVSCSKKKSIELPEPLGKPLRPHVGVPTERWPGPCWRDFGSPNPIGASTTYEYDANGFVTAIDHLARSRGGSSSRSRRLKRLGAKVHEEIPGSKIRETVDYVFEKRTGDEWTDADTLTKPIHVGPRAGAPQLCLCPTRDRSVCYLSKRVVCYGDPTRFAAVRAEPDSFSCIACGERVVVTRVRKFLEKKNVSDTRRVQTYTARANGVDFDEDKTHEELRIDYETPSVTAPMLQTWTPDELGPATMRAYCEAKNFLRCNFDAHGNLLSFDHLRDGLVKQTTVYNYNCHEGK